MVGISKKTYKQKRGENMNKKTILAILLLSLVVLLPVSDVSAITANTGGGNYVAGPTLTQMIGLVGNFIITIIAILGIIFLVWGGILYVTSAGDETQVEKAKTTITYAIIGLFVAGFAYGIEVIVLGQFQTGL